MKDDKARYKANWQGEMDSATLYRSLSRFETQEQLREVYRRMALVEENHARFWLDKFLEPDQPRPKHKPSLRTKILIVLARRFGVQTILPNVASLEQVDSSGYDNQADARAARLPQQERSHARLLKAINGDSKTGMQGSELAQLEGRHRSSGGNALRAAVLGSNDGLVSNLSLVMGVAGADLSNSAILVTGLAGLMAGACSMALGEWLSVQSARELYQRQIAIEKQELAEVPEEEQEELSLIYQSKGIPENEANQLAARIIADKSTALDTLSREELGIDPDELGGSAWVAAMTSFALFAIGAIIPVISFFFATGMVAVIISLLLSSLALFLIGAGVTLLTGRSMLFSGGRQVIFGLLAAAITFGVGRLIGVSVSG